MDLTRSGSAFNFLRNSLTALTLHHPSMTHTHLIGKAEGSRPGHTGLSERPDKPPTRSESGKCFFQESCSRVSALAWTGRDTFGEHLSLYSSP